MTARKISFQALFAYEKRGLFLEAFFESASLKEKDLRLAKEIAFGTLRLKLLLDRFAKDLGAQGLNLSETILLRMALYQRFFMDRIPLYAIVNETVDLAKEFGRKKIASYFNALLRKLPEQIPYEEKEAFPSFFVKRMLSCYPEKAEEIFTVLNRFFPPMVRARKPFEGECVYKGRFSVFQPENFSSYIEDSGFYPQNATFVYLMEALLEKDFQPKKILDLCASPGGKLLLAHDLFPKALLSANDADTALLEKNIQKYSLKVNVRQGRGEDYPEEKFDLIIVDAPCSNSGVLHKRPEARFRLTDKALKRLVSLQLSLLQKASKLLADGGKIYYFTCSILAEENESVLEQAKQFGLRISKTAKVLPNPSGWDGGFGASLL